MKARSRLGFTKDIIRSFVLVICEPAGTRAGACGNQKCKIDGWNEIAAQVIRDIHWDNLPDAVQPAAGNVVAL